MFETLPLAHGDSGLFRELQVFFESFRSFSREILSFKVQVCTSGLFVFIGVAVPSIVFFPDGLVFT